jgi:cysteine-rich repeat protein
VFVSSATQCRASGGICDVAENCTGSSAACPPDGFVASSTECRSSAGICDFAETCTGSSAQCPANAFVPSGTTCRLAGGICDVAETCTGSSAQCPADQLRPSNIVCRAAIHDCDAAENCTGTSVACPADDVQPDGTPCNDQSTCTVNDTCTSGVCSGDFNLCGNGALNASCGEECDDGNLADGDGCDSSCRYELACAPAPLSGCKQPVSPAQATFQIKDSFPNTKDKLSWTWKHGAITAKAEFGSPDTSTSFLLCVYDNGTLVSRARMPAGEICNNSPCWRETPDGWKYKDSFGTPDGIRNLMLKQGLTPGKAFLLVRGKGTTLDTPTLPTTQAVRVQLANSIGNCWEAVYSAPSSKNTDTQYKDKSD